MLGLPAPEGTEREIDRIADGTVSTTSGQTSTSRPASPDAQQPRELRDSLLRESPSTSEAEAQPVILSQQSTAQEMTDAADSLFAELLVLTGCTVVRACCVLYSDCATVVGLWKYRHIAYVLSTNTVR